MPLLPFSTFEGRRREIVTIFDDKLSFSEKMRNNVGQHRDVLDRFALIAKKSKSTKALLESIRSERESKTRMGLLKIFRRLACPVLDTETSKKVQCVPTAEINDWFAKYYRPIDLVKAELANLEGTAGDMFCSLIGEYDHRGKLGYELTAELFKWFDKSPLVNEFRREGPAGAGPDLKIGQLLPGIEVKKKVPCDFAIRSRADGTLRAIGFARYDSSRGGSQGNDRPGLNSDSLNALKTYAELSNIKFKVVFLVDGPGLRHNDVWNGACALEYLWEGNVVVTTLKLLSDRLRSEWLLG